MGYKIIATTCAIEMGTTMCQLLKSMGITIDLLSVDLKLFSNTETMVKLNESVRGHNIFIVSTGAAPINDNLFELFLLIQACKSCDAESISVILPHLPYARSDKKDHRGPISVKFVVDTLVNTGAKRITCVDLHASQTQSTTNIPFDNLYAINTIINYLRTHTFENMTNDEINNKYVLVSPDVGGNKRTIQYAKDLQMKIVKMDKERDYSKPGTVASCTVNGNPEYLKGKIAIIIDDIIDTMGTMVENTKTIIKNGAVGVIVIATHGILSGPAIERINNTNEILQVIVTDTVPPTKARLSDKITWIPIAPLLANAVYQLVTPNGSVSSLFTKQ